MAEIKTIKLEVLDTSVIQVAHAIIKYYGVNNNGDKERTLIDIQEVAEHIDAYVRAERKL